MIAKRMEMEGILNLRDLGGYPTLQGGMTRKGHYLRSDTLENMTDADCETLYQAGVRYEVDLRARSELAHMVIRLLGYRDIVYMSVPLMDEINETPSVSDFPDSMGDQYVQLLERYKEKIRTIFTLFASHTDHCFLFHCTAGKDRTGVIAMLLLLLADVPDAHIIEDYAATDQYIQPFVDQRIADLKSMGIEYPDHVFRARPDSAEKTLYYLRTEYGGGAGYLRSCGVADIAIQSILRGFVIQRT